MPLHYDELFKLKPAETLRVIKKRAETCLAYLGLTGGFSLFLIVQVSTFPEAFGYDGVLGYNVFMATLTTAFAISYLGTSISLGLINYVGNTEYLNSSEEASETGVRFVQKLELWIRIVTLSPLIVTWLMTSSVIIYGVWHFSLAVIILIGIEAVICLSLSIRFAIKGTDSTTYRDELVHRQNVKLVVASGDS